MNAYEIKTEVLCWMGYYPTGYEIPDGEKGTIIGIMNNALRMGDGVSTATGRRHQVLAWFFREVLEKPMASVVSTKELTPEMWWCLSRFIEPHKDLETGVWCGVDGLEDMLIKCWKIMEEWEAEMNQQIGFWDEPDLSKR